MDQTIKYIIEKQWEQDQYEVVKAKIFDLIKEYNDSNNIPEQLGIMLLLQQLVEQLLKEIIIASNAYVKAEIWPIDIPIILDVDDKTFGQLIKIFKDAVVITINHEILLTSLKRLNKQRNELIHNIFNTTAKESVIIETIKSYMLDGKETTLLLLECYNNICDYFYDLEKRVDFKDYINLITM